MARRRCRLAATLAAVVGLASIMPARAGLLDDPIAEAGALLPAPVVPLPFSGFASPNLEYVGTIPIDSPGVGARVVDVGGQRRLYVTGVTGLSIYDVTNPGAPHLLGHLVLPNWENEDVAVSADGATVLITDYIGALYLFVIDATNPQAPALRGQLVLESGGHTAECMDPACDWVYGSEGQIIDLRDKAHPVARPETWTELLDLPDGHAMNVDEAGIATIDTTPLAMVDASDPLHPRLLAAAAEDEQADNRTAYQHNNLRPRADEYVPRATPADQSDPNLRPGELILGNGETNLTGTCDGGSGPFATWSAVGWETGKPLEVIDVFRPVNGDLVGGDPAVNLLGCSGHWFTARQVSNDYLVAAGWYEHGTRLLRVDGQSGEISQIGYWQPVMGSASGAYWVGDHIYVVDYLRGVDILRYRAAAPTPSAADFTSSWLAKLGVVDPVAEAERQFCGLFLG